MAEVEAKTSSPAEQDEVLIEEHVKACNIEQGVKNLVNFLDMPSRGGYQNKLPFTPSTIAMTMSLAALNRLTPRFIILPLNSRLKRDTVFTGFYDSMPMWEEILTNTGIQPAQQKITSYCSAVALLIGRWMNNGSATSAIIATGGRQMMDVARAYNGVTLSAPKSDALDFRDYEDPHYLAADKELSKLVDVEAETLLGSNILESYHDLVLSEGVKVKDSVELTKIIGLRNERWPEKRDKIVDAIFKMFKLTRRDLICNKAEYLKEVTFATPVPNTTDYAFRKMDKRGRTQSHYCIEFSKLVWLFFDNTQYLGWNPQDLKFKNVYVIIHVSKISMLWLFGWPLWDGQQIRLFNHSLRGVIGVGGIDSYRLRNAALNSLGYNSYHDSALNLSVLIDNEAYGHKYLSISGHMIGYMGSSLFGHFDLVRWSTLVKIQARKLMKDVKEFQKIKDKGLVAEAGSRFSMVHIWHSYLEYAAAAVTVFATLQFTGVFSAAMRRGDESLMNLFEDYQVLLADFFDMKELRRPSQRVTIVSKRGLTPSK